MGALIAVKAQTSSLWLENVHCPLVKTVSSAAAIEISTDTFSWKVNMFCHSLNIAQVSLCFRLTSRSVLIAQQNKIFPIYVHRVGKNKRLFFPWLSSHTGFQSVHQRAELYCHCITVTASLLFQLPDRSQTHDIVTSNLHHIQASVPHHPILSLSFHIPD